MILTAVNLQFAALNAAALIELNLQFAALNAAVMVKLQIVAAHEPACKAAAVIAYFLTYSHIEKSSRSENSKVTGACLASL